MRGELFFLHTLRNEVETRVEPSSSGEVEAIKELNVSDLGNLIAVTRSANEAAAALDQQLIRGVDYENRSHVRRLRIVLHKYVDQLKTNLQSAETLYLRAELPLCLNAIEEALILFLKHAAQQRITTRMFP